MAGRYYRGIRVSTTQPAIISIGLSSASRRPGQFYRVFAFNYTTAARPAGPCQTPNTARPVPPCRFVRVSHRKLRLHMKNSAIPPRNSTGKRQTAGSDATRNPRVAESRSDFLGILEIPVGNRRFLLLSTEILCNSRHGVYRETVFLSFGGFCGIFNEL